MSENRNNCGRCHFCRDLYTKGLASFEKQNLSFCANQKKIIDRDGSCENWSSYRLRRRVHKQFEIEMAYKAIDNMQKNLSEIRQILEEQ